uniref:Uncharacterized protein n=1 Tax=Laticauda laticaudata TaxID=8630 RepID=A0A8C5SR29_LATLA
MQGPITSHFFQHRHNFKYVVSQGLQRCSSLERCSQTRSNIRFKLLIHSFSGVNEGIKKNKIKQFLVLFSPQWSLDHSGSWVIPLEQICFLLGFAAGAVFLGHLFLTEYLPLHFGSRMPRRHPGSLCILSLHLHTGPVSVGHDVGCHATGPLHYS